MLIETGWSTVNISSLPLNSNCTLKVDFVRFVSANAAKENNSDSVYLMVPEAQKPMDFVG